MLFLFYKEFLKALFWGLVIPFLAMIILEIVLAIFAPDVYLFRTHNESCLLCRDSRTAEIGPFFSAGPHESRGDYSRWFEAQFGPHQHVWWTTGMPNHNFLSRTTSCGHIPRVLLVSRGLMFEFYRLVEPSDLHVFHDMLQSDTDVGLHIATLILQRTLDMPLDLDPHPVYYQTRYTPEVIRNIGIDPEEPGSHTK